MKATKLKLFAIVAPLCLLPGCATIVEGTDQYINVNISPQTAHCTFTQKGSVVATIGNGGGQINVSKSRHDISVKCEAPGHQSQTISIESSASGWGVVGCILIDLCITDYSTGALNKYPKSLTISLAPAS